MGVNLARSWCVARADLLLAAAVQTAACHAGGGQVRYSCRQHFSEPMYVSWCRYCRIIAAELLSRLALDTEHRQIIESAHAVKPLCDMLGMRTPQQVTLSVLLPHSVSCNSTSWWPLTL